MKYDVIIIGAGPSGLLAGWRLEGTGIKYTILEKGANYLKRDKDLPYDVSYGFGGAGLFSDGKLSYSPSASQLWKNFDSNRLRIAYNKVKDLFAQSNIELCEWNEEWIRIGNFQNTKIKKYQSMYLSEDQRMCLLENLYKQLKKNVIFYKNVSSIENIKDEYIIKCDDGSLYSTYNLIMATGKASCYDLFERDNDIQWDYWNEMGVRIEVDSECFLPRNKVTLDYKYIKSIDDSVEIRTFCSCKSGVIRKSLYNDHVTYNGEATSDSSKSNIGIVVRTTNANSIYSKEMDKCFDNANVAECDIDQYGSTYQIIGDCTDKEIKKVIEQVIKKEGSGKVYGPEIEKHGYYPAINEMLMGSKGLYFIGDATAFFRGLMAAFISGYYVADMLVENRKKAIEVSMEKLKIKRSDTEDMRVVFTAQSKAYFYCRDVICQYVFENGFLPLNPFRVFDYFLSDRVDRDLIRRGNNQLIKMCDELWVFGNIADGVLFEIASAINQGKKIRFFSVGTKVEDIKEIDPKDLTFEPEVHAKQIKKQDIINFINQENRTSESDDYRQLSLEDFGFNKGKK